MQKIQSISQAASEAKVALTNKFTKADRLNQVAVHVTSTWKVKTEDVWELCVDYAEFLNVVLRDQHVPANPKWVDEGKPGAVGSEVEYTYVDENGSVYRVRDRVSRLQTKKNGKHVLGYQTVSSEPPSEFRQHCHGLLEIESIVDNFQPPGGKDTSQNKQEKKSSRCNAVTKVEWTNFFDEPVLFGVSLKDSVVVTRKQTMTYLVDNLLRQYFASTYTNAQRLPRKADRVCIIGAGPSGLHMAHLLVNRVGVKSENITLLEKSDRYGGKTVSVPSEQQKGVIHELGTCYLHPAYFAVRALFDELLEGNLKPDRSTFDEVEPLEYHISRPGNGSVNLEEWVESTLKQQPGYSAMALWRLLIPEIDTKAELFLAKEKYNQLHREMLGTYHYSMPPRPSKEKLKEMDMPFGTFLERHDLRALLPILAYGQTCQGYGSIESTETFWAMCWITPELLNGYFRVVFLPKEMKKKYQDLTEHYLRMQSDLNELVDEEAESMKPRYRAKSFDTVWARQQMLTVQMNTIAKEREQLEQEIMKIQPGKKTMLKQGWGKLWDVIKRTNNLNIVLRADVSTVNRPENPNKPITVKYSVRKGNAPDIEHQPQELQCDYLVVAAPMVSGRLDQGMDMSWTSFMNDTEKALFQSRDKITFNQFGSTLFSINNSRPHLQSHLQINSDLILGTDVGRGKVFASRDSYLALNPMFTGEHHELDPNRYQQPREQMAYQYVEGSNGVEFSDEQFDAKFNEWAQSSLGVEGDDYTIRTRPCRDEKTGQVKYQKRWTYFIRPNSEGLKEGIPWKILDIQGKNRTLYVHASTFFESVLDIVNYNNMLVDGMQGLLNDLPAPESDKKPALWESFNFKLHYQKTGLNYLCSILSTVLWFFWTISYCLCYPMWRVFARYQRYHLQQAFHTKGLGYDWWNMDMKEFLKVSPTVMPLWKFGAIDPVVVDLEEDGQLFKDHPSIPKTNCGLNWSFSDYRTAISYWIDLIKPTFLPFIGPRLASWIRTFQYFCPVIYNYVFSWIAVLSFNQLTGYSYRVEDEKGGGCYVPQCEMLKVAKEEYGQAQGERVCTHVCKIFTEEFMKKKGLDCVFEPNMEDGSCMIRGMPYRDAAFKDHTVFNW